MRDEIKAPTIVTGTRLKKQVEALSFFRELRYNNFTIFLTEMNAMKQYFEIVDVTAREVVGLKYEPTVEVEITLDDETVGRASVPAGMKNAREISIAVDNVNMEISEALVAMNALDQASIDRLLLEIDGTERELSNVRITMQGRSAYGNGSRKRTGVSGDFLYIAITEQGAEVVFEEKDVIDIL